MWRRLNLQVIDSIKPILVGLSIFAFSIASFANPVLDNIAAGQVNIQQAPNSTIINQSSQKAIINWQSFNIGGNESTHFQQPAGGVALNRINPSQGVSQIYGRLTATGQIILVNPAGIFFGPGSYVNVGGLIASTANITDEDFLNNYYRFSKMPGFNGAVINQGTIIAADNGLIALIGGAVRNDGMIEANMGQVVLASGDAFSMTFAGNDLVSFSVDNGVTQRAVDKNGQQISDGVTQTQNGSIVAKGGQVLISAKDASRVLDRVINMDGLVETQSIVTKKGRIIFSGDPSTGVVSVAGKIDASGKTAGATGGSVTITGYNILLQNTAHLDVSGDAGGGNINIGGNYLGAGPLPNANAVVMLPGAKIFANALTNGDGGRVILWSDNYTNANGLIDVRGGSLSGNGGFIETSSKNILKVGDFTALTTAANGATGTWLLDPWNVTINGVSTTNGSFDGGNPDDVFTPTATGATVLNTTIDTNLATSNVIITTGSTGGEAGNITISAPISWASGNSLTLTAAGGIAIDAAITTGTAASSLILNAAGVVTQTATIDGSGNLIQAGNGTTILSQANTYSGLTSVNSGLLRVTHATGLGTTATGTTVAAGATLNINGVDVGAEDVTINGNGFSVGALTGTGTSSLAGLITLGSASTIGATSGTFTLTGDIVGGGNGVTFQSNGDIASSGVISGVGTTLTKNGSFALTLSNVANTYTGQTTINAGTVAVTTLANGGINSSLGATDASTPILLGSASAATLQYMSTTDTTDRLITINGAGGGTISTVSLGGTLTLTGDISGGGNPLRFVTVNNGGITVSGVISGVGTTLTRGSGSSFGNVTLSNVANTYTGQTINTSGTLIVSKLANGGVNSSIGAGLAAVPILLGGGFTYTGGTDSTDRTFSITALASIASSAAGTLTLNGDIAGNGFGVTMNGAGGNIIFTGVLSGVGTSFGKGGGGLVTLTNVANTYTGVTTVGAGSLSIANIANTGQNSSIGAGSTINFSNGFATALIYTGGTDTTDRTFTATTSGAGIIQAANAGTLTLTGALNGGTGGIVLDANVGDIISSGIISGSSGGLSKTGNGTATLSGINSYNGSTAVTAGTLIAANAAALGSTTLGTTVASGATLEINGVAIGGEALSLSGTGVGGNGALVGTGTSSLSGNITLTANSTIGGTGALTLSGVIGETGVRTFTKVGSGTTIFTGNNTYSGITTISNGVLQIGANSAAGTLGAGNVVNNASLVFNRGNGYTVTNAISGSGTVDQSGSSTLIISGANSYSGLTNVNSGLLSVTNATALGTTAAGTNVAAGATLNIDSVNVGAEAMTINGNGFSVGALTGTGTSSLAGDITLGSDSTIGVASGILTFTLTGNIVGGGNAITINTNNGNIASSGVISGSGTTLTKSGTGTLTLSNVASTYTGQTNITNGTVDIAKFADGGVNSSLGATAAAIPILLGSATLGTLTHSGNGDSSNRPIVINGAGGGRIVQFTPNGLLTLTGDIDGGGNPLTIATGGTLNISGLISGVGTTLTRALGNSFGVLSLLNVANSYTGQTTNVNGTLVVSKLANSGVNSSVGAGAAGVPILLGGALTYTGGTDTTNRTISLTGLTNITSSSAGLLTLNGDLAGNTFNLSFTTTGDINLAGVLSGSGTLSKFSTGTLSLSNVANTYTNSTIIGQGTVSVTKFANTGSNSSLGTGTTDSLINIGGVFGSTLIYTGGTDTTDRSILGGGSSLSTLRAANAGTLTLTGSISTGTVGLVLDTNVGDIIASGTSVITGSGELRKTGNGTLTVLGANDYSGITTISAGTLIASNAAALGTTAAGTSVASGATLEINNLTISDEALTLNGTGVGGNGALVGTGTSIFSGNITLAGNSTIGNTGSLTLSGVIDESGVHALTKVGTGTTIFLGDNIYSGITTISNGILQIGAASTTGTLGSGNVTNDASLIFNRSNAYSVSNAISGAGTLQQSGSDILTLSGANSYSGLTTINSGTVIAANAAALGSTAAGTSVTNGATLNINGVAVGAEDVTLNGTGVGGTGVLTGTGTSSLSGLITLGSASTIASNSGTFTLSNTGTITGAGFDLTLTGSGDGSLASIIGTGGSFTKNGSGAWTLAGNNTYTGGSTIESGTIIAASSAASALGSGSVTLGDVAGGNNAASLLMGTTGLAYTNAIVLAANTTGTLTLGNIGTAISTTFSGGVTGTNNFTINNNATTGTVTFDGVAINNTGTLTHIGAGSGAAIITSGLGANVTNITQGSATSALTIDGALSIGVGNKTLTNSNTALLTVTGGMIGTGNLVLNNNSTSAGGITVTNGAINNTGTITNSGTGSGSVLINSFVGTPVTAITNNSLTSPFTILGTLIIDAGGKTLTGANGASDFRLTGGVLGTGNLSIVNNGMNFQFDSGDINPTGLITHGGSGSLADTLIVSAIGDNVTGIVQNSATATLTITGLLNIAASNKTLTNNSTAILSIEGGATGTGNLVLNNNSTTNGGITLSNSLINHTGTITNSGTGTGSVLTNSFVGANVTAITNSSLTSPYTVLGTLLIGASGKTLTGDNGAAAFRVTGGALGTGNLSIVNNGMNFQIDSGAINHTGLFTHTGTGALGNTLIVSVIGGNVTGVIQDSATSVLTLTGANTYTGGTTITQGKLQLGVNNAIASASLLTLANVAGVVFDLNNFNQSIGSIAGGGTTGGNILLGSGILTIGGNNTSSNYGGSIAGSGSVVKTGSGTLTLSNASGYTGGTTLSAGGLSVGNNLALGTNTLNLNGGTLLPTVSGINLANNISLGSSSDINNAGGTFTLSGDINGGNALTLSGTGNLILDGLIGNVTPIASVIASSALTINGGGIASTGNQTYISSVALGSTSIFTSSGAGTQAISFIGNITGNQDFALSGVGTGSYQFTINGLAANNVIVDAAVGSSNNSLTLNTGNVQTFTLTALDTGNVNVAASFDFSNIQNLVGGASNTNSLKGMNTANTWSVNTVNGGTVTNLGGSFANMQNLMGGTGVDIFDFAPGASVISVNGFDNSNTNQINFNALPSVLHLTLNPAVGNVFSSGVVRDINNAVLASFANILQSTGNSVGYIDLPNDPNIQITFYDSTHKNGEIADPFFFFRKISFNY